MNSCTDYKHYFLQCKGTHGKHAVQHPEPKRHSYTQKNTGVRTVSTKRDFN
jgi:hypothetical protein